MGEVAQKQNIIFQWLFWEFFEMPRKLLRIWRNFLVFFLNYFSTPFLIKTFFSHWRRYKWSYGRGFEIGRYLEVFVSNLISRTLGAVLRLFLILFGLLIEIFIFFAGAFVFILWLILPLILLAGFKIFF
ncbi:hypothetical protein AMJ50_02460 [Parcubacteria bacterium DG_74_3]|nr:MAG: hypothetical protein AMJ50_02460 [Parcubacteria bacterium DG_74_3]